VCRWAFRPVVPRFNSALNSSGVRPRISLSASPRTYTVMSAPTPDSLVTEWRARVQALQRFGDPTCARLWALAADELEHALAVSDAAPLRVKEAARRTGYTADHIRGQLIADHREETLEDCHQVRRKQCAFEF
jgi:hypothetical protein